MNNDFHDTLDHKMAKNGQKCPEMAKCTLSLVVVIVIFRKVQDGAIVINWHKTETEIVINSDPAKLNLAN